jgi:hypothetical protein
MKRLSFLAILMVITALAGCTAGGGTPTQPSLTDNTRSAAFVISDDGSLFSGTDTAFTTRQSFDAMTGKLHVTVLATNAEGLKSATLVLGYPSESLRLVTAEYAGGLGEDVVTAIIPRCPEVNLGAAIIHLNEREGVNGDRELFNLVFEPGRETQPKAVDTPPNRPENAVVISGTISPQNRVTLRWTENNRGDGNNDGLVGVADVTPLAMNYNHLTTDGQGDLADVLADYNLDGKIGVSDVTNLAMNFGHQLLGYDVQTGPVATGPFTRIPNAAVPASPTVLRTDINPSPGPSNGPLQYTYLTQPIDGIVYFRVVPKDTPGNEGTVSNVLPMESLANILSMTIEPPAGVDPWLVITEEAIDAVTGNEQPFARRSIQLTAMGVVEGEAEPIDVTNMVDWSLETGGTLATIGNTADTDKGLLSADDVGVVRVLARKSDDYTISTSLEIPVYAISDITLRVQGQTDPADVSVAKGTPVVFEAIGIFDDNDSDDADYLEINITPYASFAVGRPIIAPGPPPVYEGGAFDINTQTGELITTDAGLQVGFKAFVSAIFPPEAITPVIGGGYRANSNMLTVTLE